ncbi:MAG: alanine racemase [Bacteroidales bacterium]|nr:alanine racemase [Bacteroidales bacterium]
MLKKLNRTNTIFRPHFKTHQSAEVGNWFQKLGIQQISVSSVDMAWFFFQAGWKDISIVFPFNRREIARINTMSTNAQITILIEDMDTLEIVSKESTNNLGVFIKVDCGYQRTGIDVKNKEQILVLAQAISKSKTLSFKGILSHFGNTYHSRKPVEVAQIFRKGLSDMLNLKKYLTVQFPNISISLGDTPSASIINDFTGVDEMRPGNFVFYDWMQTEIGSCNTEQIAAIMICPVVAKHPERKELIIHGGAVHFSKEKGDQHYGAVCDISKGFSTQLIEGCSLKSLSQEHGIVSCSTAFLEKINIGDFIGIIPIHSCLTANLMNDQTQIID